MNHKGYGDLRYEKYHILTTVHITRFETREQYYSICYKSLKGEMDVFKIEVDLMLNS